MTPRQAEARRLALDGLTIKQIAAEMGVSHQAVAQLLRATGTAARRSPVNYRPSPTPEEVAALYHEGMTDGDIARQFGVSARIVGQRRRAVGVEGRVGTTSILAPAQIDRMLDLARQGWRQVDLAAEFGIAQNTVSETLRKNGLYRLNRKVRP